MKNHQPTNGNHAQAQASENPNPEPKLKRRTISNRENSLKSTGPRTKRGKDISRFNAGEHFFSSKSIVIAAGPGKESSRKCNELLEAYMNDREPVGAQEMFHIKTMVKCEWIILRLEKFEQGCVQLKLVRTQNDFGNRTPRAPMFHPGFPDDNADARGRFLESRYGLSVAIEGATLARDALRKEGRIPKEVADGMMRIFADHKDGLGSLCNRFVKSEESKNTQPNDKEKKLTLRLLRDKLLYLEFHLRLVNEEADVELQSNILTSHLPDDDDLNKIIRYGAYLHNRYNEASREFESLKTARLAKQVAAPLKLNRPAA